MRAMQYGCGMKPLERLVLCHLPRRDAITVTAACYNCQTEVLTGGSTDLVFCLLARGNIPTKRAMRYGFGAVP